MHVFAHTAGRYTQKVVDASDFSLFINTSVIVTDRMTVGVTTLCKYRFLNASGYFLGITLLKEKRRR